MFGIGQQPTSLDRLASMRMIVMQPEPEEDPLARRLEAILAQLQELTVKTSGATRSPS